MEMIQLILQLILQNNLKFVSGARTPRMIVLTFNANIRIILLTAADFTGKSRLNVYL